VSDLELLDAFAEFLIARVGDDERDLLSTSSRGHWEVYRDFPNRERGRMRQQPSGDRLGEMLHAPDAEHAVRWQPTRAWRECAAKRGVVEAARELGRSGRADAALVAVSMLRQLASVYAEHPHHPDKAVPAPTPALTGGNAR